IRAACKARGFVLVRIEEELNASGGTMARPKLEALLAEVDAGKLDGIVTLNVSRFTRTTSGGTSAFERIDAAGGFLVPVENGIDTSANTASAKFQRNMLTAVAQQYRDIAAEGFERAKANAVERGVHIAGTVPVGYRQEKGQPLTVDAKRAPFVAEAFRMR